MKRLALLLLLILVGVAPAFTLCNAEDGAAVDIDPSNRMRNRTGSQCVWCSLETLARHHRITALYGLTNRYQSTAEPSQVARVLRARHVRFRQVADRAAGLRIMRAAMREKRGAAIGLNHQHMVTCVGMDGDRLKIIDNSGDLSVRSIGRQSWDGWIVVLLGPEREEANGPPADDMLPDPLPPQIRLPRPRMPIMAPPGGC